jgi:hypothetical protein
VTPLQEVLGSTQVAGELKAKLDNAIRWNTEQQANLSTFKAIRSKGLARLSVASLSQLVENATRPTPLELAKQILQLDLRLFSSLELCDILSHQASINLSALFDFRNRLSKAVSNAVVLATKPSLRIQEFTFWINVAYHLLDLSVPIDGCDDASGAPRLQHFVDQNSVDALAKGLELLSLRPELARNLLDLDTQTKWSAILSSRESAAKPTEANANSGCDLPKHQLRAKHQLKCCIPSIVDCIERVIDLQLRMPDEEALVDVTRVLDTFAVCSTLEMPSVACLSSLSHNELVLHWLNSLPVDTSNRLNQDDFWPELSASLKNIEILTDNMEQILTPPQPRINGQPADYDMIQAILNGIIAHDLKKFLKWTQWNYRVSRHSM